MTEPDLRKEIARFREKLLDLTFRNPLLNYRASSRKTIEITGQDPSIIYQRLVDESKPFRFLPSSPNSQSHDTDFRTLDREDAPTRRLAAKGNTAKSAGDALQTPLSEVNLENTLTAIARESRTAIEETGINYLHLAVGFLHWTESDASSREANGCNRSPDPMATRPDRVLTRSSVGFRRNGHAICVPGSDLEMVPRVHS